MTFRLSNASMLCFQSPNRGFDSVATICVVKNITVGGFSGTGCLAPGPAGPDNIRTLEIETCPDVPPELVSQYAKRHEKCDTIKV